MRSFQSKLLVFFIPFYLLFSLAISSYYILHNHSKIKEKIIEKGVCVVGTLSHACEFGVVTSDVTLLEWSTKAVLNDEKVLSLVVFNSDGHIIMEENKHKIDTTFPKREIDHLMLTGGEILQRELIHKNSINYFDLVAPVYQVISREIETGDRGEKDKIIGYVKMSVSTEELKIELKTCLYKGVTIGSVFFFLGIIIIILFSHKITEPIKILSEYVTRFGEGKMDEEIVINSKDEIGQLADNFNLMAGKLKESQEELKRKARKELDASEERYKRTLEAAPDAIVLATIEEGRFLEVNEAFCTMLGYSRERALGSTPFDMNLYANLADRKRLVKILKDKGEANGLEIQYRRKDGTIVDTLLSSRTIRLDEEDCMISVVSDITDIKRANEEKARLENKLRQSQKMEAIGALAGGVAHDLNNILSGIVSYPELLLLDLPKDSPLIKPVQTIQESGQKAATIVQDLLTLARRGVSVTEVVSLNQIISDYLKSPEHEILESHHPKVQVETDLETNLINIIGSPVHLSKTIMNLVSNAAEAMPDGGINFIQTENRYVDRPIRGYDDVKEGDYAALRVSDTGTGISPDDMTRIFEPFYTKKVMGRSGTGLGMAVVWGTVTDHKGYIDIQSIEGKGTTFIIYFPVTRKELAKDKSLLSIEDYMGKGESILVIDDVKGQREIASWMLEKLGYSVSSVSSGEEAVEYLKNKSADLLILDMIMDPGMDGLETFKRILDIHPEQKAIIASGYSETERVKEAQRLGAGEYIKKPYTLEKIGLAVKEKLKE